MLRIFSTPNTSVSPSATMKSHDASIRPSTMMVRTRFIFLTSPQRGEVEAGAQRRLRVRGLSTHSDSRIDPSPRCHLPCHPTSPPRGGGKRECCLERQRLGKWLLHGRGGETPAHTTCLLQGAHVLLLP